METQGKNWLTVLLLCIFTGALGIHRFYVGKIGTGILWFLTLGWGGIGVIVDLVYIANGAFTDGEGYCIDNWFDVLHRDLIEMKKAQETLNIEYKTSSGESYKKDSFYENNKINGYSTVWNCPKCGATNPITSKICRQCGYSK